MEIYCEKVYDLLTRRRDKPFDVNSTDSALNVRLDPQKGFFFSVDFFKKKFFLKFDLI